MNKVLFLVGQTATGKTDAALAVATHLPALIISADSRQVYRGMEIGTGATLPSSFHSQHLSEPAPTPIPDVFYSDKNTEVWLSSCIAPNEEWSAAHFVQAARWCIQRAWKKGLLPIIVGGTGSYTEQLVRPPDSLLIPPNPELRARLSQMSVEELQEEVRKTAPERWQSLNASDQYNPRRLVRILETAAMMFAAHIHTLPTLEADMLWIGLRAEPQWLDERIRQRVKYRAEHGMIEETQRLLKQYSPGLPSLSATGYRETVDFLEGKTDRSQWLADWTLHEQQYAKRQSTWFAKRSEIQWLEAENQDLQNQLLISVKNWYNGTEYGS